MPMQFTARIPARDFGFRVDETVLGFLPHTAKRTPGARSVTVDSDHMFDPAFFERLRLWWEWHDTRAPLYISGPSGCGKTSTVMQFLARVHAPVITLTCRRHMDKSDLIGQWGVVDRKGTFGWFDGPASLAWRHGAVLLINEFSLAPPEVWVAVNDLFEGDALTNERKGECIARHPNTRVVITDNCRCASHHGHDLYRDRHVQDLSSAERFWHMCADWPVPQREAQLLRRKAQCIAPDFDVEPVVSSAMALAGRTRQRRDAPASAQALPALSTRVLIRFVELLVSMLAQASPVSDPVGEALGMAIGNALSDAQQQALQQLAHFECAHLLHA